MRRSFARALVVGLVLVSVALRAEEPLNLSRAKAAVKAYYDDGGYQNDLSQVAAQAIDWIEKRAAAKQADERLVMVFDVDETVLSNYPEMLREDFGYDPARWVEWVEEAAAPALIPVREVYRAALRSGVDVIFLTGRKDPEERAGTMKNLKSTAMGTYAKLILRTKGEADTAAARKSARRAEIEAEGWTIIGTIGDQYSDLSGGHAERVFKLPNPFYFVP
ncbi:HAD family acid phosphatase [Synoicihabitans lomoniglobus]|uniref:HAD family acid phosphatase n=1 Tax=Synoicihabitans lomoniglobus TaxID=2909285 RepID=A0AAF0A1P1_9BACT|nr:hypothetical protein [Opitutaceae bacterium LMO-M01]WED65212.1 HAD family acid phosphatase [Opitutaceae bacterium LMO-M01]